MRYMSRLLSCQLPPPCLLPLRAYELLLRLAPMPYADGRLPLFYAIADAVTLTLDASAITPRRFEAPAADTPLRRWLPFV